MRFSRKRERQPGLRNKRGGFILMEVIVAMTLLALIMTPLAAMVFKITARSHRSIGNTYRNAVVMKEVNYLEAIAYDSLATGSERSRDHSAYEPSYRATSYPSERRTKYGTEASMPVRQ